MRRISPLLSIAILAACLLVSCKNDIKINANWKETIVVYGLLDVSDSVQFIRIEKAYLDSKTGALQVAKISDSLDTDSAIVTLTSNAGTITLHKVYYVKKDSGIFANDKNPLWKTSEFILPNQEYTLNFYNPKSGKKVSAVTRTVASAIIVAPVRNSLSNFSLVPFYINNEITPKENSSAYDISMDVLYNEFSKSDTNTKIPKSITWRMVTNLPVTPNVNARMLVPKLAFLQFLGASIKTDNTVLRRIKSITMHWYGGNQTLVDYISVNQPSIGIIQKTAEFTNVIGGYGIFASRNIQTIQGIKMDDASISIIMLNSETSQLNFIK